MGFNSAFKGLIRIGCSWDEQKFKSICDISHLKLNSLKFENERIFMYNNPPWPKTPIHEILLHSWYLYVKNSKTDFKKNVRKGLDADTTPPSWLVISR